MRDVRKDEEPRRYVDATRHNERGTREGESVVFDYHCEGCGHGVFAGKEPVHCIRCGGIHFTPRPTLADGPLAFTGSLQRMIDEARRLLTREGKGGAGGGGVPKGCLQRLRKVDRELRGALAAFYAGETAKCRPENPTKNGGRKNTQ